MGIFNFLSYTHKAVDKAAPVRGELEQLYSYAALKEPQCLPHNAPVHGHLSTLVACHGQSLLPAATRT